MNCKTLWSYERYLPALGYEKGIYICRIVPMSHELRLDFIGDGSEAYEVCYRKQAEGEDAWRSVVTVCSPTILRGLDEGEEYTFYVRSQKGKSMPGLARTGTAYGTVVNYLHPEDGKYAFSGHHLCTPSLLKHPNGYLLASMDVFGRSTSQNLTLIFRSDDGGESWYHYSELFPCFWGKLFLHNGDVYMLSTSTEYGDLLIGKSSDGGKTWDNPTVLLRGSCNSQAAGWHKSAMPIIEHRGRLWTGIDYGAWAIGGHANALLSVACDADLLEAENWCISEPVPDDPAWSGSVEGDTRGFLEGNAVVLPNGEIANVLRYQTDKGTPNCGLIPILRGSCDRPDQKLVFEKYVPFMGNLSKFDILFDDVSGYYYSVVCRIYNPEKPVSRNLLSLLRSRDLEQWELVCDLLDSREEDAQKVGYQYVSFLFDGEDLLYLSRTACNGAKSFHDNNYITFHRLPNFRNIKEQA